MSKSSSDKAVETSLSLLQDKDKVQEIARMLGGVKTTAEIVTTHWTFAANPMAVATAAIPASTT